MPLARRRGGRAVASWDSRANDVSLSLPQAQADEQHEQTFESVSAGASLTYPMQCSALRKGGHIVIKGKPCKVSVPPSPSDLSSSSVARAKIWEAERAGPSVVVWDLTKRLGGCIWLEAIISRRWERLLPLRK